VIVAPEEGLGAGQDVPNDHCRSEWVDDVLVVGMKGESVNDLA
jgi:hypothetical protein